jgi:hypothetical protein
VSLGRAYKGKHEEALREAVWKYIREQAEVDGPDA